MPPVVDALASAPRLALVRALAAAPLSSGAELAKATSLHLNTVRAHLRALEAAGVVEQRTKRSGERGRPTLRYRLREGVVPPAETSRGLASLLGSALTGARPKTKEIRRAGMEWGRDWSRRAGAEDPEQLLEGALAQLGFEARIEGRRLELRSCPCPLVAPDDPAVVCHLADAATDGVLEGTPLRVSRRSHDPERRRCAATLAAAAQPQPSRR